MQQSSRIESETRLKKGISIIYTSRRIRQASDDRPLRREEDLANRLKEEDERANRKKMYIVYRCKNKRVQLQVSSTSL